MRSRTSPFRIASPTILAASMGVVARTPTSHSTRKSHLVSSIPTITPRSFFSYLPAFSYWAVIVRCSAIPLERQSLSILYTIYSLRGNFGPKRERRQIPSPIAGCLRIPKSQRWPYLASPVGFSSRTYGQYFQWTRSTPGISTSVRSDVWMLISISSKCTPLSCILSS